MADLYRDFITHLGYNVLEALPRGFCEVYKVQREGRVLIAKVGDQWYGGKSYEHVVREHQVLERVGTIEAPQEIFFRTYPGSQPLALLVKDYIAGKTLREMPIVLSPVQKENLELQIKAFHNLGMACLDITDLNVVITPEGKPRLFDFGFVYFQSETQKDFFSVLKILDYSNLEELTRLQNI